MLGKKYIDKYKILISLYGEKQKKLFYKIIFLSIFVSMVEVLSIAMLASFFKVLSSDQDSFQNSIYYSMSEMFNFKITIESITMVLLLVYSFRFLMVIFHRFHMSNLAINVVHDLSVKMMKSYSELSLDKLELSNSNQLSKTLLSEMKQIGGVIKSTVELFTEFFVFVAIYAYLIYTNILLTSMLTVIMIIVFLPITKMINQYLRRLSLKRSINDEGMFKSFTEFIANLVSIKVYNNFSVFFNEFEKNSRMYTRISRNYMIIKSIPKLVFETLSIMLILSMVLLSAGEDDINVNILPIIAVFAISFYRIIPSISRIVASYSNIVYYGNTIRYVLNIISNTKDDYKKILNQDVTFNKQINLKNLNVKRSGKYIISNLNYTISRGDKVCILGKSGVGKSSLILAVLNLIRYEGKILIDGVELSEDNTKSWLSKIAYMPQQYHILDDTIEANIVYGRIFNDKSVQLAKEMAEIKDLSLKMECGENGNKLSGGQKQRIALARALYGSPDLIILDEPTASLDEKTELTVINSILHTFNDKTVIVITHNEDIKYLFDKVLELNR